MQGRVATRRRVTRKHRKRAKEEDFCARKSGNKKTCYERRVAKHERKLFFLPVFARRNSHPSTFSTGSGSEQQKQQKRQQQNHNDKRQKNKTCGRTRAEDGTVSHYPISSFQSYLVTHQYIAGNYCDKPNTPLKKKRTATFS